MMLALVLALAAPQEFLAGRSTTTLTENLGADVGVLGDVDGDGRDDFLIATGSMTGPSDVLVVSGRTSAVLQTITPPNQAPPASIYYSSNTLRVAGAGDVDGDGYLDYLVGNQNEAVAGVPDVGSVRVYSSRDGALIHELYGTGAGDLFGAALDGGRDIDEDGYDDFLVGAPGNGAAGQAGYAQLFSGVDATVIYTRTGMLASARLGFSLALLADADGDMTPDFAIGAPGWNQGDTGYVDLFSGRTGSLIRSFTGSSQGDWFGTSIDGMGDLDGDGLTDLVVGIPGGPNSSGVQVLSSATGEVLQEPSPGSVGFSGLGRHVVALGDADGDGVPDFAASGSNLEAAAWSGATGSKIGSFSDANNLNVWDSRSLAGGLDVDMDGLGDLLTGVTGYKSSARAFGLSPAPDVRYGEAGGYGSGIAVLGDINGDGCDDYAVSEPGNLSGWELGRVEVVSGRDGTQINEIDGSQINGMPGGPSVRAMGMALASLDDLDGDGVRDLAASTFASPGGEHVIVFSTLTGQLLHDIQLGTLEVAFALAGGGDADGDGVSDLLVGLPFNASLLGKPASVLVFSGATGAALPGASASDPNASFGSTVVWIGDVNGDGRDDWATSEALPDASAIPPAHVKLYSGLDGTLLRTIRGPNASGLGVASTVPDLDHDGLPDLLMSSDDSLAGEYNGSAFIFSSATGNLLRTHRGTYTSSQGELMSFGAVGVVGDLDLDGLDDYAAVASDWTDPRRVYVFSSATGELLETHASREFFDDFGWPIAGLDVDGDGHSELLVPASRASGPHGSLTGAVHVLRSDAPSTVTYCPSLPSSSGCQGAVSTLGVARASMGSGFDVRVSQIEGAQTGFVFWGLGASAFPFTGSSGSRCVSGPLTRVGPLDAGGAAASCKGVLTLDFNTWMHEHHLQAPAAGTFVFLQAWYSDPSGPTRSHFSDAVTFAVLP